MARKARTPNAARKPPGPRQRVHIRVAYAGKGAPPEPVRGKFKQLHNLLERNEAGKIEASTVAGGFMDIYMTTTAAQETVEAAWELANCLGLSANTTIRISQRETEG
jgi:hypothetical protein